MSRMQLVKLVFATSVIAATAAAHADTHADARTWQFDVALDGKSIGYHTFNVTHDGNRQVLETEARFDVKFLFVTAFRYRHENTEVWSNGCLKSIDATTNSNGKKLTVKGERSESVFDLESADESASLPACVQTFAYWNPAVLTADRLLNSQTGEYEDVRVSYVTREQIPVAGRLVDADHYRLSAKGGNIELWYSAADQTWLGLEAPAKGGRTIRYSAVAVPVTDTDNQIIARR